MSENDNLLNADGKNEVESQESTPTQKTNPEAGTTSNNIAAVNPEKDE